MSSNCSRCKTAALYGMRYATPRHSPDCLVAYPPQTIEARLERIENALTRLADNPWVNAPIREILIKQGFVSQSFRESLAEETDGTNQ